MAHDSWLLTYGPLGLEFWPTTLDFGALLVLLFPARFFEALFDPRVELGIGLSFLASPTTATCLKKEIMIKLILIPIMG